MNKSLTLAVYTENQIGVLQRVSSVFTKRKLNIQSLTVSESEIKGIHRFTIVVKTSHEVLSKVVKQLEKQIDIIKAFVYEDEEIVQQEIALYKISLEALSKGLLVEQFIRDNHARILTVDKDSFIIEKTGFTEETQQLYQKLKPYGILQFARSGSVALSKCKGIGEYLQSQKSLEITKELTLIHN